MKATAEQIQQVGTNKAACIAGFSRRPCMCWLQNREIYITGTAPYSTGTVIFLFHFW